MLWITPYSIFSFGVFGRSPCYNPQKWQERTYLKYVFHTRLISKPSKECRAKTARTKHQPEEYACYHSHFVGHEVGGINYNPRKCGSNDQTGEEATHNSHGQSYIRHSQCKGAAPRIENQMTYSCRTYHQARLCHGSDGKCRETQKGIIEKP